MAKKGKNRKVFLPARGSGKTFLALAEGVARKAEQQQNAFEHSIQRQLEDFRERLRCNYRHVENVEIRGDITLGGVNLFVTIRSGYTIEGTLTADELRMGGPTEMQRWMRRIEQSVQAASQRDPDYQHIVPDVPIYSTWRHGSYLRYEWLMGDPAEIEKRAKADEKAKALFAMVAGQPAVDTLNKVQKIPITGSLGTKYWLLKQASYCIQRVDDGTGLCAVVPGVPLWDHLLGIKLMVENDEPAFLKIANVSRRDNFLAFGVRVDRSRFLDGEWLI